MAPKPKRKTEHAPPVEKLIKPMAVAIVAMLAYNVLKGVSMEIPRVDTSDELALREVLFGEGPYDKNYAVLCHTEATDGGPGLPISSVFLDSFSEAKAPAEFVLMDCEYVLPSSGKTVAERFNLNTKTFPTIFASGTGLEAPKQIPSKHLKTGAMLTKALRKVFVPGPVKLDNSKTLKAKCLDMEYCVVFLKGSTSVSEKYIKDAINTLSADYSRNKNMVIASVDATSNYMSNLEEVLLSLPEYKEGEHRLVGFKKLGGSASLSEDDDKKDQGRLITSTAVFDSKSTKMDYDSLSYFISGLQSGSIETKKLSTLPGIKTRTKKSQTQISSKREKIRGRAKEKARAQQEQTFAGSSTKSDTKAERKAERDRRRREHHAKNNVKPKTPEEIAAIEAQRRKRMEEEAAKWNMMEEDLADLVDEEANSGSEFQDDYPDEEELLDIDDVSFVEDDDEEILDLD